MALRVSLRPMVDGERRIHARSHHGNRLTKTRNGPHENLVATLVAAGICAGPAMALFFGGSKASMSIKVADHFTNTTTTSSTTSTSTSSSTTATSSTNLDNLDNLDNVENRHEHANDLEHQHDKGEASPSQGARQVGVDRAAVGRGCGVHKRFCTGHGDPRRSAGRGAKSPKPARHASKPVRRRSQIQFVGVVNAGASAKGSAVLRLPAGSREGDVALVLTYGHPGPYAPQVPAGYTTIAWGAGAGNLVTDVASKVLAAGETTVPATTSGSGVEVAVYRGVARVGSHAGRGVSVGDVGGSGGPLHCPRITLVHRDASSWVVCIGADDYASTNAKSMVFGSRTRNRSAGLDDGHTGLADTHAGVTSWDGAVWSGDSFRPPGRHGVEMWALELLSK